MRTSHFLEEHDHLRQSVRAWLDATMASGDAADMDALVSAAGGAGLLGLSLPAADGGQDADTLAELVLAEELGRAGAGSLAAVLRSHLQALDLGRAVDPAPSWLRDAVKGQVRVAAVTSDVATSGLRARADGDGWRVDGTAAAVVGAAGASQLVVTAATDAGDVVIAVLDVTTDGVDVHEPVALLGLDHGRASDVTCTGALATRAQVVDADTAASLVAPHRVREAGVLVGIADRAAAAAVDYARQREAFGRPIARHQVITHLLVDLRTAVTTTRARLHDVAVDLAAGGPALHAWDLLASTIDMAVTVTDDALQVHGGAGYSEEYEIQRLWRDVRTLAVAATPRDDARALVAGGLERLVAPHSRATDPTADRAEHRAAAAAWIDEHLTPQVPAWEAARDTPDTIHRQAGSAGWFGTLFAPEWGGTGPDLVGQAVWIEELARAGSGGLAADLGASIDLAALYLDKAGTDEQKRRWLVPSIRGEAVGALGITEPGTGSDVAGITTRARRDGDGWVIDGAKVFITNGPWADHVVVACKVPPEDGGGDTPHRQITLFVVEAGTPGFTARRLKMMGWHASHTGELTFEGVRVGDDHRLGEIGSGFLHIVGNFAWERLTLSLGAMVAAESDLHDAVSHWSAARREGPDPMVGELVTLTGRVMAARSLTDLALRLTVAQDTARRTGGDGPDDGHVLQVVSMSKLVTQRLAVEVAEMAVRVRGARGVRRDQHVERHLRDARLGPIGGGTDQIMRQIIASTMGL